MKTVALIGKIDIENFGDLLLARLFVEWIKPHNLRVVCPGIPDNICRQIGASEAGSFRESDLILYIGGGYFGEQPGTLRQRIAWGNSKLKAIILPGLLNAFQKKPVAIIGPGYGPISNLATRIASLMLFRHAKIRGLRDKESIDYYRAYGGRRPVVETADCTLTLADAPLSGVALADMQEWKKFAGTKKLIGVHLTKQAMECKGGNLILEQVKKLADDVRYRTVFFNDQSGTAGAKATNEQYRDVFGPRCTIVEYSTIDKLIGLLDACDLVLTSKLHVGIVSAARNTPVLAFPYHPKTPRFYKQIGREELCLPYTDWTPANIECMFDKVEELVYGTISVSRTLIERARFNRTLVDGFLATHAG